MWRPKRLATNSLLEMSNGCHGHGIDHLLMELRIAFGGRPSVLGQQGWKVEVDRFVNPVGGGIDVHYFQIFTDGSRLKVFVPGHRQRGLIDVDRVELFSGTRIEGVDAKPPFRRGRVANSSLDRLNSLRGWSGASGCRLASEHGFQHGAKRLRRISLLECSF